MYTQDFIERGYELISARCQRAGLDIEGIKQQIRTFHIETPSWAYGDSGTRFGVFPQNISARTVYQKIDHAAFVHRITGVTPTIALHIPWDRVDDWAELKQYAHERGLRIGSINPNLFQDPDYKFGSLTHADRAVRQNALDHVFECVEIMRQTGSDVLSLWLADGTNYPGTDSFRARHERLSESLREIHQRLDEDMTLLIEYKFFEPAFYHTDIPDWGTALLLARRAGPRAKVLVDLGHHPQATNIEFIVSLLLNEGLLGGFHFNDRKYADDDLTAGSISPYQLFLIFNEIVGYCRESRRPVRIAYMVDQSHNIKHKVLAMIQTVENIQIAYAKALLVDREALADAQRRYDVIAAETVLQDAFLTDVRPLLAKVRQEMGLEPDVLKAAVESDYLRSFPRQ